MADFRTTRRVEFAETDAAGIMHFSAFFPLVESVEHEFLRSIGMSVLTPDPAGMISWPRVAAHCEYLGAVRFEDVLDITLSIGRLGKKSVTYSYEITHAGRAVANAEITAVCCRMLPDQPPVSMVIPSEWAKKFKPFTIGK
jgi:acyl-CoA thioester hydrolase